MKGKDEVMRSSGVLMHISSLPSPYGIGTMGKEARKFADFLEKSGQKYWQILPICPTSYGDSPYQSFSSFAGNPIPPIRRTIAPATGMWRLDSNDKNCIV